MTGPMAKVAPGTYFSPSLSIIVFGTRSTAPPRQANPWIVAYTSTVHRQNIHAMTKEAS
ncbi:hypothetical protein [Rhizobium bangladeshense]|uniref:hypothetical protein n=1 Tax=Rhizobium bangladeshense TaxID=1138189 RepID=UPI0012E81156|nr:hypothetical protein [Rhizobium bangladeshense]